MAEYWKSTPRKYCEFCKVWMADNKASIQIHENGKMHKENVEKNLREVRKKSALAKKNEENVEKQLKAIEKAAMAAYARDLAENPQLAADSTALRRLEEAKAKEAAKKAAEAAQKESKVSAPAAPAHLKPAAVAPTEPVREVVRDEATGFGAWTSVAVASADSGDSEAQQTSTVRIEAPAEEESVRFAEKETPLLAGGSAGDGDGVGFKKRKAASQKTAVVRKKLAID